MAVFSAKSEAQLATCDARIQKILREVIKFVDFIVIEGHRGQAAQEAAFDAGTTKLHWPFGKHNASPSRAVDIAPYFANVIGGIDWKDLPSFARLMGYIERVAKEQGIALRFGLDWNGDFRTRDETFVDAPHLELAASET